MQGLMQSTRCTACAGSHPSLHPTGPAPAEDDVSAPQRITLRLPSALPTISGDDQPVLGQANAAPPSEAAPLPKSGGAAEGCDEPAPLSDVGAQSAAFKFVLKL